MRQRRANRHASKWAFAELHGLLIYKAALAGSLCIKVDADYTSQACPRCGFISRENRPRQGLLFVCQQCHYTLHADLVGARNVALQSAGHPAGLDGHGKARQLPLRDQTGKTQAARLWQGGSRCGGVRPQAPPFRAGAI